MRSAYEQGNRVRAVAATRMNERSSRSHSCLTIKLQQKRTEERAGKRTEVALNAKLNLVGVSDERC